MLIYRNKYIKAILEYNKDSLRADIENVFVNKSASKFSYKAMQGQIITSLSAHLIDWLSKCFTSYSEQDFHTRMNRVYYLKDSKGRVFKLNGIDYITDWKVNHKNRFRIFIFNAKRFKGSINLDENNIVRVITKILSDQGWTVQPHEVEGIRQTAIRLKNIIYHNMDTISF